MAAASLRSGVTHALPATLACALAVLGFAGCGGDDERSDHAGTAEGSSQPVPMDERRTETTETAVRTAARQDRAGDSKKEEGGGGGKGEKRAKAGNRVGKSEPADKRGGKSRSSNPSKSEPRSGAGAKKPTGRRTPAANGTPTGLTGAALRRCVSRAVRQDDPESRLRAQARCVGLTARQLRRQIHAACRISARKAGNRAAAERRCLKAALD